MAEVPPGYMRDNGRIVPADSPGAAELRRNHAAATALGALRQEQAQLRAAVAKRQREDVLLAELRELQAEGAALRGELARRDKRGVKFAPGFHLFGKHTQRPA